MIKTYENVELLLQQVSAETPARAVEHIRDVIDNNARLVETTFLDERREKQQQARAVVEIIRERLARHRLQMQALLREIEQTSAGSILRAVLFLTGSAACMVTEVTLSLSLPFLLNIRERSFLGLMMGIAMACTVLILDYVAERLGFSASPWELLRSAIPSRFWRVMACAASITALLLVAGLNLYTIRVMTPTREEAAKVRHNMAVVDEKPLAVDEAKVSRAVLWFSMTVTIGAALLLIVGATDLRRLCQRGVLHVAVWRDTRQENRLAEECHKAESVLAMRQTEWDRAPDDATRAAELIKAGHLFRLEQALLPKPRPKPSALETIDEVFRRSSGAA